MSKKIADTIIFQIKTLDKWALMAFGAQKFKVIDSAKYSPSAQLKGLRGVHLGGVWFKVSGLAFKGDVMITLNGSDLYDIQGYSNKGILKVCLNDVYAEDLVFLLDGFIEQGASQEDLQGAA